MISAENRHHHNRMVRRLKNSYLDETWAETRKPCSCYMCGNPRKHFKELTKQEKIANDIFTDQLKDCA